MQNLGATAAEFRKSLAAHRHRNSKLMSLQNTKTSEISSFVKNCNMAELNHLKKELNMWYKDTNFNLRKIDQKRENMYKSLLQLSTAKKKIKSVRQGKKQDEKEQQKWLESKQRPERRRNICVRHKGMTLHEISQIDMSANERNVLKIRHTDDDVITALQTLPEDDEEPNNNNNNNNNNKRVDNNFDYTTNPNFDGTAKQLLDEERHHKVERDQTKTNQTKTESLSKQKTANKPKKCRRISENFEGKRQSNTGMKRNLSVTFNFSSSLATENLDSVIAEKPEINHEQMPDELHIDHESRTNSHDSQIVSVSQSQEAYDRDYFPENPLPFDAQSTSNFIDRYVAEQQRLSEARLFDNNEDNYFIEDYNLMPLQPQNKQYKRKKRKKKHKINPSHQLNTISSIQARPGQRYEVAVYTKSPGGNLEKEVVSWDTTINVYKHFNIAAHRERLQRKQLLIDAQNYEIEQRHRVNRFLETLDHELEQKNRAEQSRRKKAEEEKEALKRRIEALKKGPPKYGVDEGGVPSYVRSYIPGSRNPEIRRTQYRKKSSWALPSMYTMQLPARANSIYPKSTGTIQVIPETSSSHLVNINIDKYMMESANVLHS